jgi:hypothetical protein
MIIIRLVYISPVEIIAIAISAPVNMPVWIPVIISSTWMPVHHNSGIGTDDK